MEILLDDGEKALVDYLSQGRYDRARQKNAKTYDLNKTNNRYFMDRVGLFAELALAKITNTYPNQVISPVCKTKDSGDDVGDIKYNNLNIDVKATIHNDGVLWIDKINNNIDVYAFFVVKEEESVVRCTLKGIIKGKELHSKPRRHRRQFKFPCIYAEQNELSNWNTIKDIQ